MTCALKWLNVVLAIFLIMFIPVIIAQFVVSCENLALCYQGRRQPGFLKGRSLSLPEEVKNKIAQSNLRTGHATPPNLPTGYNGAPTFAPNITPPVDRSPYLPHLWTHRPTIPNRIDIRLAVLPQCTGQTDRHTYRPTNGWRECSMTVHRVHKKEASSFLVTTFVWLS